VVEPRVAYAQVINAMSFIYSEDGRPIRWFFCFGTLLEYICDLDFSCNYDIDIGVLYEEVDGNRIKDAFFNCDFMIDHQTLSRKGKPLNVSFVHKTTEMPAVDVYFWYPSGKFLWHTYDTDRSRNERPEKYVFKGIKKDCIIRPQREIDEIRSSKPEMDRILDERGTWWYDLWDDHGDVRFPCPYYYGTLLDVWYPCWRHRKYNKDQSKSKLVLRLC